MTRDWHTRRYCACAFWSSVNRSPVTYRPHGRFEASGCYLLHCLSSARVHIQGGVLQTASPTKGEFRRSFPCSHNRLRYNKEWAIVIVASSRGTVLGNLLLQFQSFGFCRTVAPFCTGKKYNNLRESWNGTTSIYFFRYVWIFYHLHATRYTLLV